MKRMIKQYLNIFNNWKGWNEKLYCVICGKYRTFENPKTSHILEKNLSSFYYLQ